MRNQPAIFASITLALIAVIFGWLVSGETRPVEAAPRNVPAASFSADLASEVVAEAPTRLIEENGPAGTSIDKSSALPAAPALAADVRHAPQPIAAPAWPLTVAAQASETSFAAALASAPASEVGPHPTDRVRRAAFPETSRSVMVNPVAPGNAFVANGQRVTVEAQAFSEGDEAALDVVVAPAEQEHSSASERIARSRRALQPPRHPWPGGLTYEEELFRTKWGWAAFNQAQRVAWEVAAENPDAGGGL